MKYWMVTLLISVLIGSCSSGKYISLDFSQIIASGDSNEVVYYVGENDKTTNKKVLLYISGTGRYHVSEDFGQGAEASLFGYSIVYPQKSFVENPHVYFEKNSREQRLHDINVVIDDLVQNGTEEILIMAVSEGTMFAPEIASQRGELVSGLICMGGSVNSFESDLKYTFENRIGRYEDWGVENVDSFVESVEDIFNNPARVDTSFMGHSYKFWSGFLRYEAYEDLKDVRCPVLYINGELDEMNIDMHLNKINQLKNTGVNIEHIIYQNVGHELSKVGKKLEDDILEWAKKHNILQLNN